MEEQQTEDQIDDSESEGGSQIIRGDNLMTAEAKIFWWPNINKDIEDKVKHCITCMSSGRNLKYLIPKKERKFKKH